MRFELETGRRPSDRTTVRCPAIQAKASRSRVCRWRVAQSGVKLLWRERKVVKPCGVCEDGPLVNDDIQAPRSEYAGAHFRIEKTHVKHTLNLKTIKFKKRCCIYSATSFAQPSPTTRSFSRRAPEKNRASRASARLSNKEPKTVASRLSASGKTSKRSEKPRTPRHCRI